MNIATLIIAETGNEENKRIFEFMKSSISVGRGANNDLQFASSAVSTNHFRILSNGNGYRVIDLGSTNGTLLNSKKLIPFQENMLKNGDMITIANYDILFTTENSSTINSSRVPFDYRQETIIEEMPASTDDVVNNQANDEKRDKEVSDNKLMGINFPGVIPAQTHFEEEAIPDHKKEDTNIKEIPLNSAMIIFYYILSGLILATGIALLLLLFYY